MDALDKEFEENILNRSVVSLGKRIRAHRKEGRDIRYEIEESLMKLDYDSIEKIEAFVVEKLKERFAHLLCDL